MIICMLYIFLDHVLQIMPDGLTAPHEYELIDESTWLCRCKLCGWYSWNGGEGWHYENTV
jgi:hypothetical protein